MLELAKYVRNCVVFWENLHSWQKFYTTTGRDGRDKFQVWETWWADRADDQNWPLWWCQRGRRARGHLPWPHTKILRDVWKSASPERLAGNWTPIDHPRSHAPTRQKGLYEVLARELGQEMAAGTGQPLLILRQWLLATSDNGSASEKESH